MKLLKSLLGSKKFFAFLIGLLMLGFSKLGWGISEDMVTEVVALVAAYIMSQGIADHGKEAAKEAKG